MVKPKSTMGEIADQFLPPSCIIYCGFSSLDKNAVRVWQSVAVARGARGACGCSGIRGPTSEGACCTFPQRLEGPHDQARSRSGIKTGDKKKNIIKERRELFCIERRARGQRATTGERIPRLSSFS
jgi:hypothetical protein